MDLGFYKKVVVVPGGLGTLGLPIVRELLHAGARVAVLGRDKKKTELLAEEGAAQNADLFGFFCADVGDKSEVELAATLIAQQFGEMPSILINMAGGNQPGACLDLDQPLSALEPGAWDQVIQTNMTSVLNLFTVFGDPMVEAGFGRIVTITSVSAIHPLTRVIGYSAAKAAAVSLMQSCAVKWGKQGVLVNGVAPGFFLAEQNRRMLVNDDGIPTERGQRIIAHTPLARFGRAQELVLPVLSLASPLNAFTNGHNFVVDGGFSVDSI